MVTLRERLTLVLYVPSRVGDISPLHLMMEAELVSKMLWFEKVQDGGQRLL
jgi:hypothetical protein